MTEMHRRAHFRDQRKAKICVHVRERAPRHVDTRPIRAGCANTSAGRKKRSTGSQMQSQSLSLRENGSRADGRIQAWLPATAVHRIRSVRLNRSACTHDPCCYRSPTSTARRSSQGVRGSASRAPGVHRRSRGSHACHGSVSRCRSSGEGARHPERTSLLQHCSASKSRTWSRKHTSAVRTKQQSSLKWVDTSSER